MITCIHCNTQNDEMYAFCSTCGKPLSDSMPSNFQPEATPDIFAPQINMPTTDVTPNNFNTSNGNAPQATFNTPVQPVNPANYDVFAQQPTHMNMTNYSNAPIANNQNSPVAAYTPNGNGRFVSADEVTVATLSNNMLMNPAAGQNFRNEDAVLTNKRLYYNHKDGIINVRRYEEKVDVKDITGTKIASFSPYGILITAILIFISGIVVTIEDSEIGVIVILAAIIPLILFFCLCRKFLKIEYPGGCIHFSVKKYGMYNIQAFLKSIYIVKDEINNSK